MTVLQRNAKHEERGVMGEDLTLFRADFNTSIHIESRPERLTSESGALILRDVMERLGVGAWLEERLRDRRNPDQITHPQIELLRTSVLLLAQGSPQHARIVHPR